MQKYNENTEEEKKKNRKYKLQNATHGKRKYIKCDRTAQIQQMIQSSMEATEKLRGIMIVARKLISEEL